MAATRPECVSDKRVLETLERLYDADETIAGGGVIASRVAEELPLVESTVSDRLRTLATEDDIEIDWGIHDGRPKRGYRPLEDAPEDPQRTLVTDGGGYRWDGEDCPCEDCNGNLQHQGRYNVECLACGSAYSHYTNATEDLLVDADLETVARKPRVAADGGSAEDETEREKWPEYRICRECADTGATVLGNDGNYRHDDCARSVNERPYLEGRARLLGASVTAYRGGEVRVTPSLRHITSRLGVTQLANRLGTLDDDYVTLHPTPRLRANGEDGEVLPDGGRSVGSGGECDE